MTVKFSLSFRKLNKFVPNVRKNFAKEVKKTIVDKIVDHILSGKSPVKFQRFKQYSVSYAKVKGRRKPVDMKVSGDMLKSLKAKQKRNGTLEILFESVTATYHDGRNPNVRRRLLPRNGEEFSPKITREIVRQLKKVVKRQANKT